MSYRDDVLNAFTTFAGLWKSWPYDDKKANFWHVGNSLDSCVDLIIQAWTVWGDNSQRSAVGDMVQESYNIFNDVYQGSQKNNFQPGYWWDDFGWWGVTFLKIYQNFSLILDEPIDQIARPYAPVTQKGCLDVARSCWGVMQTYAWTDANSKIQPPYQGPVAGGCWNNYGGLTGGIQNSVTNGLFLTLSIRLYLATNDPQYLQGACNSYVWYRSWLGRTGQLFADLDATKTRALAYERPHDPNNPSYNSSTLVPYTPGQRWTGDQGLLLGGLAAMLQIKDVVQNQPVIRANDPNFGQNALQLAQSLVAGVEWLFDSDIVLHESQLNGPFGDINKFLIDYSVGKGVYMRYLAATWQQLQLSVTLYIIDTAVVAIQNGYRPVSGGISLSWNTKSDTKLPTNDTQLSIPTSSNVGQASLQTSRLDALNAAIPLIPIT